MHVVLIPPLGVVLSVDGQDLPPPAGPLIPEKGESTRSTHPCRVKTHALSFLSQKARTLERSPRTAPPTRRNRRNQRNYWTSESLMKDDYCHFCFSTETLWTEVTSEHLTKMFPAGRLSRGRLILRHGVIITCDNQTLVGCQSLCEEAGYNQLRIQEEQNLFLQQTRAKDTSTYPAGGKIHLPIVYSYRNEKERMETSLRGLSLLLMASHLQQACAFILNGSMWGDVHPGHHLVTAVKGKQKRRKKLLHSEYRGYFLRTPWKCTMSLTMVQLQSHKIQSPKTLRNYPLAAVCMIMWKSVWFPRQRWHLSMAPAQKHCNIYLIGWTEI